MDHTLRSDFISTPGTATWRTPGHFDLSINPLDLWIMFPKPQMSEDKLLSSEVSYCKSSPFRMIFVMEDEIDGFRNGSSLIRSTINIEDRYRMRQFKEIEMTPSRIVIVNQVTGSPTINQGVNQFGFQGVRCL